MILYNGNILTIDQAQIRAKAVAILAADSRGFTRIRLTTKDTTDTEAVSTEIGACSQLL